MLTSTVEMGVSWTSARDRNAVTDGHVVLVVLWVGVAAVPDTDTTWDEAELERFVLCAFPHATRKLESSERVSIVRLCWHWVSLWGIWSGSVR
jgi:hypothetical protein